MKAIYERGTMTINLNFRDYGELDDLLKEYSKISINPFRIDFVVKLREEMALALRQEKR